MSQTYPVVCECGKVHQVPAGYAGTRMQCPCGKVIEVPSLSELRTAAGQPALSPELEIGALMARKELPLEPDCALCGCQTSDSLMLLATCETPTTDLSVGFWARMFSFLIAPLFGLIIIPGSLPSPTGRRVQLRFPIRMCPKCAAEVSSWDVIRKALRRTPVYARLLDRYPGTGFSTLKG